MQYDVITLDSDIFLQNGSNFEGGLLAQLSQFKEGSALFVLSEVVLRELKKHLETKATESKENLEKAIRDATRNGLLSEGAEAQIKTISAAASTPKVAVKRRLEAFIEATSADIIPADQADIKELTKRYFSSNAPFESSGKKKHEFPDAIALLAMESWAKTNKKKILAVSNDGGWSQFAAASEWIDVEKDLATALQRLQQHAAQANVFVEKLLGSLDAGKNAELMQTIVDEIADAVADLPVNADASSAYQFESDWVSLAYQDFSFLRDGGEYEFKIVQTGNHRIVAKIRVSIKATAETSFSFSVYDSIDKDYVPIGSSNAKTEIEFEAAVLITFEGVFDAAAPEINVSKVELVEAMDTVDFGEIDLEHSDEG